MKQFVKGILDICSEDKKVELRNMLGLVNDVYVYESFDNGLHDLTRFLGNLGMTKSDFFANDNRVFGITGKRYTAEEVFETVGNI
jgi:hypothetical protein